MLMTDLKNPKILLIVAGAILGILVIVGLVMSSYLFGTPGKGEQVIVEIPKGAGLVRIAGLLEEKGVVKSAKGFCLLAKSKSQAQNLKAGEYALPVGVPPKEILKILVEGRALLHKITIPEGFILKQVAQAFAKENIGSVEETLAAATDKEFLKQLQITGDSTEGYLFPETYYFLKGETPKGMIRKMVAQFFSVYNEEKSKGSSALSMKDAVILASICQAEARKEVELPLIARVYLNRLRIGMPLQADPTVAYGLGKSGMLLSRKDLKKSSPYNTYLHKGLPPGPIGNPGRLALRGVFQPTKSDALYFVAKDDGSHHFSNTYDQHLQAVRKYR